MKKQFVVFALISALISCKKETTNTTTSNTTNNPNSVVCVDNPDINFTAIGTPVGKFSDCIKDIDGNVYKTVTIGTQTWMAENLKTTKYNDGTSIPNVKDSLEWSKLNTGAWCYYNNDEKNNAKYGKLYNWYAVSPTTNGNKNVCPTGWHVPTDAEWTVLTDYLGGESVAGGKLKEVGTTSWKSPNTEATNITLFSALPGGNKAKYFEGLGEYSIYCSSSLLEEQNDTLALGRAILGKLNYFAIDYNKKISGLSIRCLKD